MTDLISRPILRVEPSSQAPERPVAFAAAVAAAVVAGVGLVAFLALAVAGWFAAGTGSFGSGMRAGALAWLLVNGASLHTTSAAVTAVPLGGTLIVAWLLYGGGRVAGRHSTVHSLSDIARGTGVLAVVYCLASLAVVAVSRGGGVQASPARTAGTTLLLGLACGGAGLLRGSCLTPGLVGRVPAEVRAALIAAAAGIAVMFLVGALLVAASLAMHFSTAVDIAEGLHAGLVGGALMALVGVAVLPNAVLYAGAFAAGPGFALGSGTAVAPGGVTLGALPAFPLLAAVPQDTSAGWLQLLVVVPVIAGVVAGLVAVRRGPAAGVGRAGLRGTLAGLLAGGLFAAMGALASGSVGPGRMHHVGPDVGATLVVCVAAGTLGGAVAAAGATWVGGALTRRKRAHAT
jgi:hypothetical protein